MRYMDGKFDVCCRMLALVDLRDRAPVVGCRAKRCRHSLPRQNPSGNAVLKTGRLRRHLARLLEVNAPCVSKNIPGMRA